MLEVYVLNKQNETSQLR